MQAIEKDNNRNRTRTYLLRRECAPRSDHALLSESCLGSGPILSVIHLARGSDYIHSDIAPTTRIFWQCPMRPFLIRTGASGILRRHLPDFVRRACELSVVECTFPPRLRWRTQSLK